jgi:hypothetical protein
VKRRDVDRQGVVEPRALDADFLALDRFGLQDLRGLGLGEVRRGGLKLCFQDT